MLELLESFGWPRGAVLDLGDITAARGPEMYLPLWLRLMGPLGGRRLQHRRRPPAASSVYSRNAAGAGSTTRIVVPAAGLDSAVARPPYSSAMCLTIASPRPVPGPERAFSTRWKRSNTRPRCSGGMPAAGVVHDELHGAREAAHAQLDALALAGVADRVLDQVVEHRVDEPRRHRHDEAAVGLRGQRHRRLPGGVGVAAHARLDGLGHLGRLDAAVEAVALELDEHDHVLDQAAHAVDLEPGLGDHLGPGVVGQVEAERLDEAEDPLQRRAQLVRHARREQPPRVAVVGLGALVLEDDDAARAGLAAERLDVDAVAAPLGLVHGQAELAARRPPGQRRPHGGRELGLRGEVEQRGRLRAGERVCPHQPAVRRTRAPGSGEAVIRASRHARASDSSARGALARSRRETTSARSPSVAPAAAIARVRSRRATRAGRRRSRAPLPTPPSLLSSARA